MDLGFSVTPDLAGLIRVEGVGRADDEVAVWFEVVSECSEKLSGVFDVFNDFAGDDGVELFLEVHGLHIGADDVVAMFF